MKKVGLLLGMAFFAFALLTGCAAKDDATVTETADDMDMPPAPPEEMVIPEDEANL
ncbi:MAG TPA: hypothetical protein PLX55_01965 [bacterium]|jgi:hypothetical protein|nr:hypothetical protein [bacterium]HOR57344.1 hypothetical protein [bacterium]HPL56443.1 hypothetical protein [bacterium]HPM27910.1 hypothetical protein [bacterium]